MEKPADWIESPDMSIDDGIGWWVHNLTHKWLWQDPENEPNIHPFLRKEYDRIGEELRRDVDTLIRTRLVELAADFEAQHPESIRVI